jgi:hypothetical protein
VDRPLSVVRSAGPSWILLARKADGLDHAQILPRASDMKEPFSFAIRSYRLDYKTMTNESLQTGVQLES